MVPETSGNDEAPRISGLVIDCEDVPRMTAFWAEALGYEMGTAGDDFAALAEPAGGSLRVLLQKVPEPKAAKNRVHFDLTVNDRDAEVRRLSALGASAGKTVAMDWGGWTVMSDPEGNEFCVAEHHH